MASYRYDRAKPTGTELTEQITRFGIKFMWFLERNYTPHIWQLIFHSLTHEDKLCRFRHLVAGRRGGKTLSAAWELAFYAAYPHQFHQDAHKTESDRPLWAWVLTKDYPLGRPALLNFREVLKQAGLEHGKDYKENRGQRYFEFDNGSLIEFKTADDPQSLRGAGLDLLWIDEAAAIPNNEAYDVVYPALADREGLIISTTTPQGKNWFYNEFWNDKAIKDPNIGRVEYRTADNPFFPKHILGEYKERYHPMLYEQEFLASFDSMAGRELSGDWLHYYEVRDLPDNLETYMGVDPAISLRAEADNFAMALIGLDREKGDAYLLDLFSGKLPFPEQVKKIQDWWHQHRPNVIGVENNAYQAALGQQVARLEALAPIASIRANSKKSDRILAMAPLFKLGRIRIRKDHRDFIKEWVDYDSTLKNPQDDCLDAVEIAIRAAGAILPQTPTPKLKVSREFAAQFDLNETAKLDRESFTGKRRIQDVYLGEEW